jgi:uncharacterized protein YciW
MGRRAAAAALFRFDLIHPTQDAIAMPPLDVSEDVIDRAAGLAPGDPLHGVRRFRAKVVEATQASHDALLQQPVEGLSTADRLRFAAHVCTIAGAASLARHYEARLADAARGAAPPSPALPAMLHFAATLTTDPRRGDRAALEALRRAGLGDPAIVALAQLVAFLSYQTRVVAGLRAMQASGASAP